MEPMTLGSPVGSPAAAPSSPGGTSPYLPEFLMGNDATGIGTSTPNTVSPSKLIKHVTFGVTPTMRSSTPVSSHQERRTNREVSMALRDSEQGSDYTEEGHSIIFREQARRLSGKFEKASGSSSGPPTCGLFDTLSMPSAIQPKSSADVLQQKLQGVTDLSFSEASWTAEHESGNTWVTIFGFQPNAASYILSQFAHYGNIVQKKMPLKGNWIHVQYSSKIECRKALSYNGKIFGGSIMVGVIPCRDREIVADMRNKENIPFHSSVVLDTSQGTSARQDITNQSFLSNSSFGTPTKFNASNMSYASPEGRYANIRPLGQAYRMAQAESEITPQGAVPRKSNSMVSKAMEYVLGW